MAPSAKSTHWVSVYDPELGGLEHFDVPEAVYVYIKQLEAYIRDPEHSKLLDSIYRARFEQPRPRR
jgi:hypothetical protein